MKNMNRPWQTRSEFLVSHALVTQLDASEEELRVMQPISGPRPLFPPRTSEPRVEWTVDDVLDVDRYAARNDSWVSGAPVQRSVIAEEGTQASSRYSMEALWG